MLKDYLIFSRQGDFIKTFLMEDIKYFIEKWGNNEPQSFTFHKITGTKYNFARDSIIKLISIQNIEGEVILKEVKIINEPSGKLKCYFAHPWRSRESPDKKRIIAALEGMKIEVVDPFMGEDNLCTKYGEKDYYPNCNYKLGRALWIKDLAQIRDCDMFLMWADSKIPGRFMGISYELAYAFALGKHIQIISDLRHPYMAYVLCHGNRQYNNIEDFEKSCRIRWK